MPRKFSSSAVQVNANNPRSLHDEVSRRSSVLVVPLFFIFFIYTVDSGAGVIAVRKNASEPTSDEDPNELASKYPTVLITVKEGAYRREFYVIANGSDGTPYRDGDTGRDTGDTVLGRVSPTGSGTSDTIHPETIDRKFEHRRVELDYKGNPIYDPLPCIRNGHFQQIAWLGVASYMVVNHYDRDIVLVDPWPTYCTWWFVDIPNQKARLLEDADQETLNRLQDFVNFLRFALMDDYKVSAILLSHMHYDHADDIPAILELLARENGNHSAENLFKDGWKKTSIKLLGEKYSLEDLPTIVCDFDSMVYLKTQYFGVNPGALIGDDEGGNYVMRKINKPPITSPVPVIPDPQKELEFGYWWGKETQADAVGKVWFKTDTVRERYASNKKAEGKPPPWYEIEGEHGRLFYDDCFNHRVFPRVLPESARAVPGQRAKNVELDHCSFVIEPYVGDHMNLSAAGQSAAISHKQQGAGGMQRITSFMVHRKLSYKNYEMKTTKRTFFVGSSAEMHADYTKPGFIASPIETDVLIHGLMGDKLPSGQDALIGGANLAEIQNHCRRFICDYITVVDYLVPSHWDEFVRWISKVKSNDPDEAIKNSFGIAYRDMINAFKVILKGHKDQSLIEDNKILALGRLGSNPHARKIDDTKLKNDVMKDLREKSYPKSSSEFEMPIPLTIRDLMRDFKRLV